MVSLVVSIRASIASPGALCNAVVCCRIGQVDSDVDVDPEVGKE